MNEEVAKRHVYTSEQYLAEKLVEAKKYLQKDPHSPYYQRMVAELRKKICEE